MSLSLEYHKASAERFLNASSKKDIVYGVHITEAKKAEELVAKYGIDAVTLMGPFDFCQLENTQRLAKGLKPFTFDAVVFNAGMFCETDDFNDFDLDCFVSTFNCNFYTPLILATSMKDHINPNGSIVIISCNDAYYGSFASMSYSLSKAALISLMKCLSVNFGKKNIRVNSVAPGSIDTGINTLKEAAQNDANSREIKKQLLELLEKSGVKYEVNGDQDYCVPTTLNVSFLGVSSEALMLATKQYCGVSNGSACTSSRYNHSHVLSAMHLPDDRIESAIRMSWGREVNQDTVNAEFENVLQMVKILQ